MADWNENEYLTPLAICNQLSPIQPNVPFPTEFKQTKKGAFSFTLPDSQQIYSEWTINSIEINLFKLYFCFRTENFFGNMFIVD